MKQIKPRQIIDYTPNWGVIIIDLAILVAVLYIAIVWQDNPSYLWLLLLLSASGNLYNKRVREYNDN